MKTGFIGAGKVGVSLGKYFSEKGIDLSGYYSNNPVSATDAASFTESKNYINKKELIADSEIIFITVPDGAIASVYEEIRTYNLADKCLIHCSGALSSEVFYNASENGASACSMHPLCAVNNKYTGYKDLSSAYFTIEGSGSSSAADLLKKCGNIYETITSDNKIKYHASAVFASNLVVGIYDFATKLLCECGLSNSFSENALKALFIGNATNIFENNAINALTGPVERADAKTVAKHLNTLSGPEKEIYRLISKELVMIAMKKNPNRKYDEILEILEVH